MIDFKVFICRCGKMLKHGEWFRVEPRRIIQMTQKARGSGYRPVADFSKRCPSCKQGDWEAKVLAGEI